MDAEPSCRALRGSRGVRHPTNDQSTAQHHDAGFLLAFAAGRRLEAVRPRIPVTDVAPTVLSWFGIPPQPWMKSAGAPAIRIG